MRNLDHPGARRQPLDQRIGCGAIGDIKIGVPFLKLDRPNFERFRREFTLIQNIKHPHLVRALEFSEYRSFPFLVQEFIAGQSLEKHLRDAVFSLLPKVSTPFCKSPTDCERCIKINCCTAT